MRYFAVSDIHGCKTQLCKALESAGFDENDPGDFLIVCGDAFDRGSEPVQTYAFLKKMADAKRAAVVRGNHEYLLAELIDRGCGEWWDATNGTADTLDALLGAGISREEIKKWIFGRCVDYFIVGRYVCVHSWVPIAPHGKGAESALSGLAVDRLGEYGGEDGSYPQKIIDPIAPKDFGKVPPSGWEGASWIDPLKAFKGGLTIPGMTIVGGHKCSAYFHRTFDADGGVGHGEYGNVSAFVRRGYICLDGRAFRTGKVNVILLKPESTKGRRP
jgi:hypothetical protein